MHPDAIVATFHKGHVARLAAILKAIVTAAGPRCRSTAKPSCVQQVRTWSRGPRALALASGQSLPDNQRQGIVTQMAAFAGLRARFILDNDLRVEPAAFRKELPRDRRRTLGRYDVRSTGIDADAGGDAPGYDPSDTGTTGTFVSSFTIS